MNILQRIFTDYYEEIKYTLHPRKTEMENIDKMINCGDPSFGGAMYGCPHCGKLKFVPFRCHSRFCPTCGNKYSMDRTTSMSFKLPFKNNLINKKLCTYMKALEIRENMINAKDDYSDEEYNASLQRINENIEEIKQHLLDDNMVVSKGTDRLTIKIFPN